MKYRNFGKLDFKPSALGFGTMRLPTIDGNSANIDEAQATEMLHYAIDQGVNYIDTAYVYHKGQSEVFLGKALKNGLREKVKLADKLSGWLINTHADLDHFLNEQLQKLQTDHIDFYLLHALTKERWQRLYQLDIIPWAEKAIKDGKIGHLGFSFHDNLDVFKEIIDAYDKWTFCQIQYNLLDVNFQAGEEGLKYAVDKGLTVVIMEPLKGGYLANPPPTITKLWGQAENKRTPASWALSWLWNQPEVSLVLSGMSTLQQVKENCEAADNFETGSLNSNELLLIKKVQEEYQNLSAIPCTGCNYCQPCPKGVRIPKIFEIFNEYTLTQDLQKARESYQKLGEQERASNCISCGQCGRLCPQSIKISEKLKEIDSLLG
jgi:predicted aldo/keto reductase-like oxidoreductase